MIEITKVSITFLQNKIKKEASMAREEVEEVSVHKKRKEQLDLANPAGIEAWQWEEDRRSN